MFGVFRYLQIYTFFIRRRSLGSLFILVTSCTYFFLVLYSYIGVCMFVLIVLIFVGTATHWTRRRSFDIWSVLITEKQKNGTFRFIFYLACSSAQRDNHFFYSRRANGTFSCHFDPLPIPIEIPLKIIKKREIFYHVSDAYEIKSTTQKNKRIAKYKEHILQSEREREKLNKINSIEVLHWCWRSVQWNCFAVLAQRTYTRAKDKQ